MAYKAYYVAGSAEPHWFPDDMDDSAVAQALGALPPPPASSVATGPAPQYVGAFRGAALAGQAAVKGLAQTAGLPGDVGQMANAGFAAAGVPWLKYLNLSGALPTSESLQRKVTDPLGLTNSPSLTPTGAVEKVGTGIMSGLAGGAAMGPLGGLTTAGNALLGAASGAGGSVAQELLPGNVWAGVGGGLAGGLLPAGLRASGNAIGKLAGLKQQLEDLQLAGGGERQVNKVLTTQAQQAFLGEKGAAQEAQAASQAAAESGHGEVMDSAQGIVDAVRGTPATTLQEAGARAQDAARSWLQGLPDRQSAIWDPVASSIPGDTLTPLNSFTDTVQRIATSGGELRPLLDLTSNALPRRLWDQISRSQAVNAVDETVPVLGQNAQWENVNQLRSSIGDMLSQPALRQGMGEQQLKALYASLKNDMRAAAEGQGPEALSAFENANTQQEALHAFQEQHLSKLVSANREGRESIAPEAAARQLLSEGKSGGSSLQALRTEVPQAADALAHAHLSGLDGVPQWGKLSEEAQAALIPSADHRQALTVASGATDAAEQAKAQALAQAKADYVVRMQKAQESKDSVLGQRTDGGGLRDLQSVMLKDQIAESDVLPVQQRLLQGLLGGEIGVSGLGGALLAHSSGLHLPEAFAGMNAMAGAALGAGAPEALRRLRQIARDPEALKMLGIAGAVGSGQARASMAGAQP